MREQWLKQTGTEVPTYSPFDPPDSVVLGMGFIGELPRRIGKVVGQYTIRDDGSVIIELYKDEKS